MNILQKPYPKTGWRNMISASLLIVILSSPKFSFSQNEDDYSHIDSLLILAWENRNQNPEVAKDYLTIAESYAKEVNNKPALAKYMSVQLLFSIRYDSLPENDPLGATGKIVKTTKKIKDDTLYTHPIFVFYDASIDKNEERLIQHIDDWRLLGFDDKDQQMLFRFVFSKILNNRRKATSFVLGEHMKAVEYAKQNGFYLVTHSGLRDIAQIFGRVQNYQKSIFYYEQLLEQYYKHPEEIGKFHRYLEGDTYYRIGTQYLRMESYREAINAINKAYPLIQTKKKSVAALAIRFKGTAYERLHEYDSAIAAYDKAMNAFGSINSRGNYIGTIYKLASAYFLKNDYTKSNKTYWKAIRQWQEFGDEGAAAYGYYCLGRNHVTLKNLDSAKIYLTYAEGKLRKHIHSADIANLLSQVYETEGKADKALQYYKKYNLYKDSLDQSALRKEVMFAENRNLLDQKQQELQKAQLKQKNQKYITYATGVISILLLGFAISIAVSLKQKKKDNKKLLQNQEEIQTQNTEIQAQNEELYQQAEELQVQREYLETQKQKTEKAYATLERNNESIKSSIQTALTIQKAILPSPELLDAVLGKYFVIYRPKDVVSGDFYWVAQRDGKTFITVVDCTGHGVPGAFMSLIGNSLLNRIIKERKVFEPASILEELDYSLKKMLKDEDIEHLHGMDMSFIALESNGIPDQMKLTYAGAKNDIYYIDKEQGDVQKLLATRRGIASSNQMEFEEIEIILTSGSKVYMFSDGFSDQNNPQRRRFGRRSLIEKLRNTAEKPIHQQGEFLNSELEKFMDGEPQRDDITLLGFEV